MRWRISAARSCTSHRKQAVPDALTQRCALVTGATGFIGRHLSQRLIAEGWEVHCIVRPSSETPPAGAISHVYDGTTDSVLGIVEATAPDIVFHLASLFVANHGPSDVEPLVYSNVLLGAQLLEGMSVGGCRRLVNTGTCWQHFGDADYDPVNLYAATKQALEDIIQYYVNARDLTTVTLKIYDTYGPDDTRGKLVQQLVKAALEGHQLKLSPGGQKLELVHIDDVVQAFTVAADLALSGHADGHVRYAVRATERLDLRAIVSLVERISGHTIDAAWGALSYRQREVLEPWRLGQAVPGWTPEVRLEAGIREVVEAMIGSRELYPGEPMDRSH
jgi:nucleoside-diphosphate-sugar epimerase